MSLITYARQSLGLALAQERFAGSFIRNQGAPSGMVKINNISETGFKRLKAQFDQINTGPHNAGKVLYGVAIGSGSSSASRRRTPSFCRSASLPSKKSAAGSACRRKWWAFRKS